MKTTRDLYDALKREQHLKQVLLGVRNVNQLITKETDPQPLITKACNSLTETLSYYHTWIALTDQNGRVTIAASSGNDKGFGKLRKQLKSGVMPSCVKKTIDSGNITIIDEPLLNCPECPLSVAYERRSGLCSMLSFNERIYGFIAVSAPGEFAHLEEEHELFKELADDLGFALYKIENEQKKLEAEKQLVERVKELSCLFAISKDMQLNLSDEELFNNTVKHLANAMRFPELTVAVIEFAGKLYSKGKILSGSRNALYSEIMIDNKVAGKISVFYTQDKSFLPEEQNLVDHISHSVSIWWEHKQSVEALRENEKKLRQITDNITDVVFITDMELNTIYVSPSVEKMIGIPAAEYLQKPNHEKHPEETILSLKEIFLEELGRDKQAGVDKNRTRIVDGEHFLPDGSTINISMHVSFLRDDNGNPVGLQGISRDITRRIQIEKELLESKNYIQTVMDNLPIGIAVNTIDQEVEFQYINDNFIKFYRTSRESLINPGSFWEAVYEDAEFREKMKQMIVEDVLSGDPERMVWVDIPITRKGEETTYITARNIPLQEKNMMISTVWDVTERKRAEISLQEKKAQYQSLFENNHSVMLLIDPETGNIVDVNPAAVKYYGWNREEFLKMNINEINTLSKEEIFNEIDNARKTRRNHFFFKHRRADQSVRSVETYSGSILREGRELLYSIIHDITDRVQAEEKLKNSDRIFNHAMDLLCIAGFDGYFKVLNPSWSRVLGWSREELLSKPWIEFVHPDDKEATVNIGSTLIDNKEILRFENRYICKDGSVKWLSWNTFPYPEEMIMYGVARDITEQKTIEAEIIRAKEKAQESDRLKTSFLNNISHEIRTPMNGILGFTQLITEPDTTAKDREYYSRIIMQSGNQLLSIIDDIIHIATIETGQEQLRETETDLNRMLDTLYMQFNNRLNTGQVMLNYQTKLSRSQAMIMADETKLTQVLSNLIANAQKFTEQGRIEYTCELQKNMLLFCVKDTGIGIDEKFHETIFERFRQVSTETTREYGGNGLGLAISKAYVELMGGKIWVESKPGKGSSFYFTIPYKTVSQSKSLGIEAEVKAQFNDAALKAMTILLAEDEYSNSILIETMLKPHRVSLIHVTNGKDAVEELRKNSDIDMVLMDLKMPGMSGFEATKIIKKEKPALPVIAITAYALAGDREKALETGCDGYITKPVKKQDLLNLITKYV